MKPLKHTYTGIVVAGGLGTRLRPLTEAMGKPLLPVGDRPMIGHAVEMLAAAGVRRVAVVIAARDAASYFRYLGDGSRFGVSLCYACAPDENYGMPHSVKQARPIANPGDRIVVCAADVLIEEGIAAQVKRYDGQKDGSMIITAHMEDTAGYGLLDTAPNGTVRAVLDKDKNRHAPGYIELGAVCFPYAHFACIEALFPTKKELPAQAMYRAFQAAGRLTYAPVHGYWTDAGGSLQQYHEANARAIT